MKKKDRSELKFQDMAEVNDAAEVKFKDFEKAWRTPGHTLSNGKNLRLQDALTMWEAPIYIPKVISNNIQEAVEPMLIGTSLLEKVGFQGPGTFVDMPVMGAVDGDFEIGEGEQFPEFKITYGPAASVAMMTQKYGVACSFTEEVLRFNPFSVVTSSTRQAAKALARTKEEKIFNMFYKVGRPSHDNTNPLNSACGTTTGRDMTGALNGSVTMDDVFESIAQVMAQGYSPDIMIVHPLMWMTFIGDAQLRAFAIANQTSWFGSQWSGNPSHKDFPDGFGGMAIPGGAARTWPGNAVKADAGGNALPVGAGGEFQNVQAGPVLPAYGGFNLRMIVSPWVPFNTSTNRTTVIVADSSQLGYFIEDYPLQVSEWKNPENDILKIKMHERYLVRPKNRGFGIVVMKNVSAEANKVLLPAQTTIGVAGSIAEATRNAAV